MTVGIHVQNIVHLFVAVASCASPAAVGAAWHQWHVPVGIVSTGTRRTQITFGTDLTHNLDPGCGLIDDFESPESQCLELLYP